jgi:DNA-binding GntR family transcriptional regulator
MRETKDGTRSPGAVAAVIEGLREMIRSRDLLPGEPVRQQDMAERLGVSRVPVREALHALETEGLLLHRPNQGYFVAKFSADQLNQIYLMRRLLETALVQQTSWPDERELAAITAINDELARAAEEAQIGLVVQLNRQFHEAIFALSPMETVHQEVSRLWDLSDSYRAFYLAGPSRLRTAAEHEEMIDALRKQDLARLLDAMDRHRLEAQDEVGAMLGGPTVTGIGRARAAEER